MKRRVLTSLVSLGTGTDAFLFHGSALTQQESVPEITFDSDPNFQKLPADLYLGEASAVAVNSKGHVFVFSRGSTTGPAYGAAAAQILEFGSEGKYLREIRHDLCAYAHAAVNPWGPNDG